MHDHVTVDVRRGEGAGRSAADEAVGCSVGGNEIETLAEQPTLKVAQSLLRRFEKPGMSSARVPPGVPVVLQSDGRRTALDRADISEPLELRRRQLEPVAELPDVVPLWRRPALSPHLGGGQRPVLDLWSRL